jgi:hypothetical protein
LETTRRIEQEAELAALAMAEKEKEEDERMRAEWLAKAFRARDIPASHYAMEKLPAPAVPFPPTEPHTPALLRRSRDNEHRRADAKCRNSANDLAASKLELSFVTSDSNVAHE